MKTEQWYEVLRHDGTKQYATKTDDKYFLWGYGFPIGKFDAVSVTPVDSVPTQLVEGFAYWDDGKKFRALSDVNRCWNGWAMPYIHNKHIKAIIKGASHEDCTLVLKDGIVTVNDLGGPVTYTIEPEVINGELWYWFGHMGWVWSFDKKK